MPGIGISIERVTMRSDAAAVAGKKKPVEVPLLVTAERARHRAQIALLTPSSRSSSVNSPHWRHGAVDIIAWFPFARL
jgi:hypothetical protein